MRICECRRMRGVSLLRRAYGLEIIFMKRSQLGRLEMKKVNRHFCKSTVYHERIRLR
jgi:hypothetical protein